MGGASTKSAPANGVADEEESSLSHANAPARRPIPLAIAAALILALLAPGWAEAKQKRNQGKGKVAKTMTRNVYLGANLEPAIGAEGLGAFVEANGQILREVTANNFPRRARGLAREILGKKPDLVGLQEVALWRTGPPSLAPVLSPEGPTATTVRYDYLRLLLDRLNKGKGKKGKGKPRYRVVVLQDQVDFEAPADENGVAGDGPIGLAPNAEINGRLTIRDVILAKRGAGVVTKRPKSGNFANLMVGEVSGQPVTITRGWTAVDAKVRGGKLFRFVNTHLEAFEPNIRALQAGELVARGGPATSRLPVVLLGDLNSDNDTVEPVDRQAYRTLVKAGMRERSTGKPLSCCLNSSLLAVGAGGSVADFDHQVDHVMTRDPRKVKLKGSSVTGRKPVNGFWSSDHAGVFSALRFLR